MTKMDRIKGAAKDTDHRQTESANNKTDKETRSRNVCRHTMMESSVLLTYMAIT